MVLMIRNSTERDVEAMLAIYTQHVKFGLELTDNRNIQMPKLEDLKRRRKNMSNSMLPHLVAEEEGIVVGYAYAVQFRKRPAYKYAVKHSIYIDHKYQHKGIGRRLLPCLIDACAAGGYRQMIGYIDSSNQPSIKLHEAFGFKQSGYLSDIGFKFGKWTDCVIMQRSLGEGSISLPEKTHE
jgi:L-amino acid N-acyltransferase YncA